MWSDNITHLEPFVLKLRTDLPKFIRKTFNDKGIVDEKEMILPMRPVKLLGKSKTSDYIDCPNLPKYHLENIKDKTNPAKYTSEIGQYYWFDFDAVASEDTLLQLRMVFNEGSGDTNDGFWGAVWNRNTQELIADIMSTGDFETTIEVVSTKALEMFESQKTWIPVPSKPTADEEEADDYSENIGNYSPFGGTFVFANDVPLEKIISLAIRFVSIYFNESLHKTYGYD